MAGDWIKMRAELATHPRLLSIVNTLTYGDDPGFLVYVCGADALDIETMPPSNETVTQRALRIVTESALHDVTLAAITRVWCCVNAHCKVEENDAIVSPMALVELDRIAGFSGFGIAMRDAGWVVDQERNSLRFPNFLEFNEPACLRKQAKSNADRQREYRLRHKGSTDSTRTRGVTKVTKRNDREEKRREEKSSCPTDKKPPTPLPPELDTEEFRAAWADWLRHRSEIKRPVKPTAAANKLRELAAWGAARAAMAIRHSIGNGWQGIFEEHDYGPASGKQQSSMGSPARPRSGKPLRDRHYTPAAKTSAGPLPAILSATESADGPS